MKIKLVLSEDVQREKFEAWAEKKNALPPGYLKKCRLYTGFYSERTYTCLWSAWKAAGADLVEELETVYRFLAIAETKIMKLVGENKKGRAMPTKAEIQEKYDALEKENAELKRILGRAEHELNNQLLNRCEKCRSR